jgi:hypothetical protein
MHGVGNAYINQLSRESISVEPLDAVSGYINNVTGESRNMVDSWG